MGEHKCQCAGCTASSKQGAAVERERIIALLYEHGHYCEQPLSELIALINGEN